MDGCHGGVRPLLLALQRRRGWRFVDAERAELLFSDCRGDGAQRAFRIAEQARQSWHSDGAAASPPHSAAALPRVSCFPGLSECVRKAELSRSLSLFQRLFPHDFDFVPQTFDLRDARGVAGAREQLSHGCVLIVKPSRGSQGSGIRLVQHFDQLQRILTRHPRRAYIAQRYIDSPLLLDGVKCDLRIFVLVTSLHPLRLTLFKEGLVRLCTEPYDAPGPGNLQRALMHLSNYALNKAAPHFRAPRECVDDGCVDAERGPLSSPLSRLEDDSSKRSVSAALAQLSHQGSPVDVQRFWSDVSDVVEKTVIALQPELWGRYAVAFPSCATVAAVAAAPPSACFHLLGFDLLLDSARKLWLLEVNAAPSLHTDSPLDCRIKESLIDTLVQILQPTHSTPTSTERERQQPTHDSSSRLSTHSPASLPPPLLLPPPCSGEALLTGRSSLSISSSASRNSTCSSRPLAAWPPASASSLSRSSSASSPSQPSRRSTLSTLSPSSRTSAASLHRVDASSRSSSSPSPLPSQLLSQALRGTPRGCPLPTAGAGQAMAFVSLQPSVSSSSPHLLLFTHPALLSLFARFSCNATGGVGLSSTGFRRLLPLFCPPPFAYAGCSAPLSTGELDLLFLQHATQSSRSRPSVTFDGLTRCLALLATRARPSAGGASQPDATAAAWSLAEGRMWMDAAWTRWSQTEREAAATPPSAPRVLGLRTAAAPPQPLTSRQPSRATPHRTHIHRRCTH